MDVPRFTRPSLNPTLAPGDLGDSFQAFVHELLLPEYSGLEVFPGGGKDGAIDLLRTISSDRLVVECKQVGSDGKEETAKRWKKTAANLAAHLRDPLGPTPGQHQYAPWFTTAPAIRSYVFCTSAELANADQKDSLRGEIRDFFVDLGSAYPHVAHLAAMSVEVLDWGDLRTRLRRNPHLLFRWFPRTRPLGLVPFEDAPLGSTLTFRNYLDDHTLRYYSRREHLAVVPPPPGVVIPNENELVELLTGPETTGLMITGSGGHGKTRLTLEIGRAARERGWTALRVRERLRREALDALAERITPEAVVLLLVDYIETQRDFAQLVEDINDFNDSYQLRVRYVANCRTSYYAVVAGTSRHRRVDLSADAQQRASGWYTGYRQSVVRHILDAGGVAVTDSHLAVCRDTPVLAVFLSFLQRSGRTDDLRDLLRVEDFGSWIHRRVQLSFPGEAIHRDLALLVALFPASSAGVERLSREQYGRLVDVLASDGWIGRTSQGEGSGSDWVTAHDVFADQIVLSFARTIAPTAEFFVRELLSFACEIGCLRSTLLTLQRLVEEAPLTSLDWLRILSDTVQRFPDAARGARDLLIRTSLLDPADCIRLLAEHGSTWDGAEDDVSFQNALGWLTRNILATGSTSIPSLVRETLGEWTRRAASRIVRSNFLLTVGLRHFPDEVRPFALDWVCSHPLAFQTHYLLVAWLEMGLGTEFVRPVVAAWIDRFATFFHFSFVASAWLDAQGDKVLVRESIAHWLELHRTHPEARFVYQAWLDAQGDKVLIREPIAHWLELHRTHPEARFVYRAWLDAQGDKVLVREPIAHWLELHSTTTEAGFVYKAWLDAQCDKELVREPIAHWLELHRTHPEAGFVYKAWLDAQGDRELVQEPIAHWLELHRTLPEAGFVYKAWLDAQGDRELVREPIAHWLELHRTLPEAGFVYQAWLDALGDRELVREPIAHWLELHRTFPEARFVYKAWLDALGDKELVRESIAHWLELHRTHPEAGFVYKAWLAAQGDKELVREPIAHWLELHRTHPEAGFVYKAWLAAQGDKELVREPIAHWLHENEGVQGTDFVIQAWLDGGGSFDWVAGSAIRWLHLNHANPEAVFVLKHIVRQPNLDTETIQDALSWCRNFPESEDALWRLVGLADYLLVEEVAEAVIGTSEAVLQHVVASSELTAMTHKLVSHLLLRLVRAPGLRRDDLRARVDVLLVAWMRVPASYGRSVAAPLSLQHAAYVVRVMNLIHRGSLDLTADYEAIRRFLRWVDTWDAPMKAYLQQKVLQTMRSIYPGTDLWDLVTVSGAAAELT